MKVLALYLPQYHVIAENNHWWGEGYTEWTSVRQAKPLYKGHNQPRIPLDNNYYNLADESGSIWKWQAEIAQKYGIYGFCIYHYWFGTGKQLLEKPAEILLAHPEIDIKYCMCWANETWTRTWYDLHNEILIEQEYGEKDDWIEHFRYLLKFFKDPRYIKVNNKPIINIYHTCEIDDLSEMLQIWNGLAKENGFDGVYLVSGNTGGELEKRVELVDAYYNFEPGYTLNHKRYLREKLLYKMRVLFKRLLNYCSKKKYLERKINIKEIYRKNGSGEIFYRGKPIFPGTVPMWDNTPRRSYKGLEYTHCSPEKFYVNLLEVKKKVHQAPIDFLYVNAWNEWGEGAYLEPDTKYQYQFLEKIRKVVEEL